MGNGGESGESNGQREAGDVLDSLAESLENRVGGLVEDGGLKERSIFVDLKNAESVREGTDLELLEKSGFGVPDLLSGDKEEFIIEDLDLTLVDLGGDVQGLEECCLSGFESGISLGNGNFARGDSASLGRGRNLCR